MARKLMTEEHLQYDYIIIGAGSAGCVLANRLSANGNQKVCLIEAGPLNNKYYYLIPSMSLSLLYNKKTNWSFHTIPQVNCENRRFLLPEGRILGGTSALNGMVYTRGNAGDYDNWAALGNIGWSYQDILPYFKKLENCQSNEENHHHLSNPLSITLPSSTNPLVSVFLEAARQAGYEINKDLNSNQGMGVFHVAQKNGYRHSNANAYLDNIKNRKNLTIHTNAEVTKILFSKDKTKATGINYLFNGQLFTIYSKNEIILSAGVIKSPHLLLLSGIGPEEDLQKHGIKTVRHLPGVGKNLQDHFAIPVSFYEKTGTAFSLHYSAYPRLMKHAFQYLMKKKGVFSYAPSQAGGFIKTNLAHSVPDFQFHFFSAIYTGLLNVGLLHKHYGYTLTVCNLHPKSRGAVTLQNSNPLSSPLIDPNFLSHEDDINALVVGYHKARDVLMQKAFDPYRLKEYLPGTNVQTSEQIKEYIKRIAEPIYHLVGTCKMGTDKMAVVNPRLKVHSINGLRVVDASIMPTIPSGNTNAPTTMIAEKAADMIMEDNNTKHN